MRRWLAIHIPIMLLLLGLFFGPDIVAAILPSPTPTPTSTTTSTPSPTKTPPLTSSPTSTDTPLPTNTLTPSGTPTPAYSPTTTLTPSRTPTITPTPIVRGRVLQQSNCRYGPGSAYLYEWGLFPGNRVTVLGRNQDGSWVYVDPWNYIDYCWIKTDLLEILSGDVSSVVQIRTLLPYTEFYWPPRNVRASRQGDEVWVSWELVPMSRDDDRGYLIEAWLCQDGQLRFTPLQFNYPPAILIDEPGCSEPSSGRIYTAEKHGYTMWIAIPWPPYPSPQPTLNTQAK